MLIHSIILLYHRLENVTEALRTAEFTEQLLALIEPCRETFWSGHSIAVMYKISHEVPINLNVEPDANPSMMADIWRHEELFRVRAYKHILSSWWGLAPHRHATIYLVPHSEDLVPHLECRVSHTTCLDSLWKGEADGSQAV